MTEEIKEILDNLYRYKDEDYMKYQPEDILTIEDVWLLLDYITNLQEENEKLKYNARGQVNDYFKDKYADEVLKKADLIKDFELTCYKNYELQQENEKLKNFITNLISTFNHCELNGTKKLDIVSDYIKQEYENILKDSDNNEKR